MDTFVFEIHIDIYLCMRMRKCNMFLIPRMRYRVKICIYCVLFRLAKSYRKPTKEHIQCNLRLCYFIICNHTGKHYKRTDIWKIAYWTTLCRKWNWKVKHKNLRNLLFQNVCIHLDEFVSYPIDTHQSLFIGNSIMRRSMIPKIKFLFVQSIRIIYNYMLA